MANFFIKIGPKTGIALVLASAVIVWAVIAPGSFQAAVNEAADMITGLVGVVYGG